MICYDPLWETMKNRGVSTYTLINQHDINPRTIHQLKHNKSITLFTLDKLCHILDCGPQDIVCFTKEEP